MRNIIESKIIKILDDLVRVCGRMRSKNLRISCTTGVFDILHDGHLDYLLASKSSGDILIVGIDSDKLVKKNKGDSRPILPEKIRSYLVAGLECVDLVYITGHPNEIIRVIQPEVFIMSKSTGKIDHRKNQISFIESYGGKVIILEPMSQTSTTAIIEKIRKLG